MWSIPHYSQKLAAFEASTSEKQPPVSSFVIELYPHIRMHSHGGPWERGRNFRSNPWRLNTVNEWDHLYDPCSTGL